MKQLPVLALIAFFCVVSLGHAAGTVALPKTGQTTCYSETCSCADPISCTDTGQDGDIQAGTVWPSPRFIAGTGTETDCITDNLTGLMWPKSANLAGTTMTWNAALSYANALSLCGYTDWRLPNISELESLVDAGEADITAWLMSPSEGFTDVKTGLYCSSTTLARSGAHDYDWTLSTSNGGGVTVSTKGSACYVWPVRGNSGSLPKTGQTVCYNATGSVIACAGTGQDGEIQAGVAWPSPRFTEHANETVTDNLTGLMWTKDMNTPGPAACAPAVNKIWREALDYVDCLNAQNYAGLSCWRLPNRKELLSLFDRSKYDPPLPAGNPFTGTHSERSWSSTTRLLDSTTVWVIEMQGGGTASPPKTGFPLHVWPVCTDNGFSLSVSKSGTGSGSVTSSPAGINCGAVCSAGFLTDAVVTLTATPAAGSTFTGWSGGCSGTGTCTVTMTASKSITANFKVQYTLITLKSFTAKYSGGKVTLQWKTASEFENAGFYLVRSVSANGGYERVNARIIPAKGTVVKGASYTYTDKGVQRKKTYYYQLEDIDTHGKSALHGPVPVQIK